MLNTAINRLFIIKYSQSFLIILSALIAYYFPFTLLIISYAILGPLHYLTQVSWLHNKNYFIVSSYRLYILLCLALTLFFYFNILNGLQAALSLAIIFLLAYTQSSINPISRQSVYYILILSIISILLISKLSFVGIFLVLLPTFIHVCIFTFIFMLEGYRKRKKLEDLISCILYIICALLLLVSYKFYPPQSAFISNHIQSIYSNFLSIDYNLMHLLSSSSFIAVAKLVAFAYTYHYFNWFSKVNIIGWSQVPLIRIIAIIILWLMSLVIYFYDYTLGLKVLFGLSFIHVLLEFPLNHLTIRNIIFKR